YLDRVGAIGQAHTMPGADERGILLLEGRDRRPVDERARGQHLLPARCDLVGHARLLGAQVDERNRVHCALPSARAPDTVRLKSSIATVPRQRCTRRLALCRSAPCPVHAASAASRAAPWRLATSVVDTYTSS